MAPIQPNRGGDRRVFKAVLLSLWACGIMLGAGYAASRVRERSAISAASVDKEAAAETRKLKELNVPKIRDGAVRGYIVVQMNYSVRNSRIKGDTALSDAIASDETFQYLYNDETVNFDHLEKLDIKKMTSTLIGSINARLKTDAVVELAVQEFTFLPSPP